MKSNHAASLIIMSGIVANCLINTPPARGQDHFSGDRSVIGEAMSVEEIRYCLCAKMALDSHRGGLVDEKAMIEDRQVELTNLEAQISQLRSTMDPADRVAQQILKGLIDQQIGLRNHLQSDLRPHYRRSIEELTQSVETYNQDCATKVRFEADERMAMHDLQCPAP